MNLSRLTRRLVAGAAGLALGVVGTLAFAAPASAHHTQIVGTPECITETGEWLVTWTVDSAAPPEVLQYQLTAVEHQPADSTLTGFELNSDQSVAEPFTGEQRLPGDATSAVLTVHAKWDNGHTNTSTSEPVTFDGTCDAQEQAGPIVVSVSTCDLLVFILDNSKGTAEAQFTFTPNETATHGHASGFSLTFDENGEVEDVEAAEDAGIHEVVGEADSENPVQLTFPAGADLHAHAFEAFDGLEVAAGLSLDGEPTDGEDAVVWEQPEDCEDGGGQGGGGDDDSGLPVTGTSTGLIAGGALALLALGGGLYLVARRRRVSFTA